MEIFKRHHLLLSICALFVFPLVVYRANSVPPSRANPLDQIILGLTAPLEKMLSFSVGFVSERWYRYVDVMHAREDNVSLRRQLLRIDRKLVEFEALDQENRRLRGMLELRERNPAITTLPATVIAAGHSPLALTLRIDRGLVDGVKRGMAVMTEAGLLGRVQRAAFHSADVVLLTDEKVSLEVVIARSRVRGRLQGGFGGSEALRIVQMLRTDDVKVGDRVLSSGLSGVFPRGVPVGVVSRAEMVVGEQDPHVVVQPEVDFSRVEQVLVVLDAERQTEPLVTPPEVLPDSLEVRTSSTS